MASAPVAAAVLDREHRYVWVNQALAAMNGRSAEEHIGRTPRELIGPLGDDLEAVMEDVMTRNAPEVNRRFSGTRPSRPGEVRHWLGSYYPLHDAAGQVIAVGALVSDVTQHQRADELERRQAAYLAALVRVSHAVAMQEPPERVFLLVAEEAAGLVGVDGAVVARFEPDGVVPLGVYGTAAAADAEPGVLMPASTMPLTELVRTSRRSQRLHTREPDALGFRARVAVPIMLGGELWGAVTAGSTRAGALPQDAEERLAAFAELVAQAVRNADEQQRLVEQATRDALTGLCNRHAFRNRVDSEAERARRHNGNFSLILIDLDHFKRVNDTLRPRRRRPRADRGRRTPAGAGAGRGPAGPGRRRGVRLGAAGDRQHRRLARGRACPRGHRRHGCSPVSGG